MTEDHTHSGQRVLEWEQGTFSILPHWILFSPTSSNAVRTYAVLAKYRDADTGQAFPSRATLAKDVGVRSVRSIDGYLRELRDIGALSIKRRRKPGPHPLSGLVYRMRVAADAPLNDGGDQLGAAPDSLSERRIRPRVGVLGAKSADQVVAGVAVRGGVVERSRRGLVMGSRLLRSSVGRHL